MEADKSAPLKRHETGRATWERLSPTPSVLNGRNKVPLSPSNCCLKVRYFATALVLFSWIGIVTPGAIGATLVGEVVALPDGDTVTLLDSKKRQYKVRLSGIDTPEKRQPFGSRAQQALASMVFHKQVTVEWHKTDRYGRLVGKVLVSSVDVGLELVRLGMAWHYKAYQSEQSLADRLSYSEAEYKARNSRVGLWQDLSPLPPWEFRRRRSR